jgi:HD domain
VAIVAAAFRTLDNAGLIGGDWKSQLPVMVGLVIFAWLFGAVVSALIRTDALRTRFGVTLRDELRVQLPIGAATGASALLIAFAAEVMGLAAVAVFAAPLLVTQVALRRNAGISATYLQAVRALARVTEIGGYVEAGHSVRVSRLSVAIGRDLGMPEAALLELEYAALMHDIGQLSLRDPIPGGAGATVLVSEADQERIAELGADVIRQAGVLEEVAELVRCQSWPARGRESAAPLGSMIIRAANTFDDLVGASTDRERSASALDRMRQDPDHYNSRVVAALTEVAGRRPAWRL